MGQNASIKPLGGSILRGWINFNGTGVIAINDSFNVSGIVDNGVGDYTITWDTDFANANYACGGMAQENIVAPGNTAWVCKASVANSQQVGSLRVYSYNGAPAWTDCLTVMVMAAGDQ